MAVRISIIELTFIPLAVSSYKYAESVANVTTPLASVYSTILNHLWTIFY
jgi:hypothetical protein